MRSIIRVTVASAVIALAASLAVAAPSQAATWCAPGSGSYASRCYSTTTTSSKTIELEVYPAHNDTSRTGTYSCSLSGEKKREMSASNTVGVSLTAGIKAGIFASVEATVSANVTQTLTQSRSESASLTATHKLKPGETLQCIRTYSYITAKTTETIVQGSKVEKRTWTSTVPSEFGLRVRIK